MTFLLQENAAARWCSNLAMPEGGFSVMDARTKATKPGTGNWKLKT